MANSDIIKIGFDYRASLAQFEKETNGVFDGISNKAGKQKITIQLDAKDDKVIDKIKELQKLKLDKFTFEFGDSGLKEQLQTFDKLETKINEIINLGKGKSFIDSSSITADIDKIENKINELNKKINTSFDTKNKTEAYNQLKKYADAFKDYYNNEEAMASESGTKAAYAYYKAYEEALKKEVAQSKLEKVTVDFDVNDKFFDKNRIVSDRIKEYANYKKYGNDNDLLEEISSLKNKLFDFNSAYSQVKEKLGQAAITPEIIKSVERYVELLDKARFLEQLNDPDDNDTIKSHRAMAQASLDDALFNAQEQSYKYTKSLRQQEEQLTSTVEAEEKLAEVQKETTSNSVTSDNSQIEELKSDIQEVKTELGDVKDRISSIESNGFENVREDVEKTKESVKELNSELTEMKSNLSSAPQESNISSGMKDAFHSDIDTSSSVKSLENLEEEIKKIFTDANELQNILDSLHNGKYFHLSWTTDGIDETGADERVRQLSKLLKEYGYTINNFKSDSDAFDTSGVINAIKEENNVLEQNTQKIKENTQAKEQNANVNFNKYDKRLDSYNGKIDKYKTTIDRFNDGGWTSNTYLENVQAVKNAVHEYETLLNELKGKDASLVTSDDISKLDEYEKKIKDTIATVTNMSAAEKGYNFVSGQKELDKIHKLLAENSKMSSEAKAKIKAYYAEIESGNPSMSLDKIHGEILKIYNAEVEAGRAGRTLWDTLKNSGFHQIAAQMAGMIGVYDVINLGKEAISTIVSLDDALVDLKKTTAMNSTQLEQYYYDANDVAKQMGVTTEEIINQSSAWSRLGYNTAEASTEMAKLSSQFASISPGMEVDEAQSGLVSIMKAWSIDPDQVKSEIMDPINQLGNTMAEDNQDIVEGMERSAAALAAVGTNTKDAFALFSGIQEVLQNAEKSGTSLRSVALRLRSFDETTGEYSEDLANITGELIDLTKTAEHAEGVSIFKPGSTTEFKDLTDYFREIAGIWDEMTQKQQNDFLIKAFGRNQAQAGAALIQNFEAVDKALAEMGESAGSSDKEMEAVESSLSYKINALKETWVGCVQDMIDRGDLGTIVTGLTKVSEAITFLLDKLGILGSIGLGAGIFSGIKNVGRDKMYSLSFEYADNIHNLLWIQRFKVCYP